MCLLKLLGMYVPILYMYKVGVWKARQWHSKKEKREKKKKRDQGTGKN